MLRIATYAEANTCYVYVDTSSQNKSLIRMKMLHIYTSVSRFNLKLPTKKFNHEPGGHLPIIIHRVSTYTLPLIMFYWLG